MFECWLSVCCLNYLLLSVCTVRLIAVHTRLKLCFFFLLFLLCINQDPPCPTIEAIHPFCFTLTFHPLFQWTVWCCIVIQTCRRALSWNLFYFYQHYFWFSRSLQSLYWHKLIRFNQLQTHSTDRTLHLRYYDGSPSQPMFPEPWQT